MEEAVREPCPTCGGTGKWFVWDRSRQEMRVLQGCANCNGSGLIPVIHIETFPQPDDRL